MKAWDYVVLKDPEFANEYKYARPSHRSDEPGVWWVILLFSGEKVPMHEKYMREPTRDELERCATLKKMGGAWAILGC